MPDLDKLEKLVEYIKEEKIEFSFVS